MEHAEVQERFSDYWDESIDEAQKTEIAAHLASCPACAAEYKAFSQAMTPLGKLHRMAAPETLPVAVPEIIQRRSRGRFFQRKRLDQRLPIEWISLGMLLLVALVYVLLKLSQPLIRTW